MINQTPWYPWTNVDNTYSSQIGGLNPIKQLMDKTDFDTNPELNQPTRIGCTKFSGFRLHQPQAKQLEVLVSLHDACSLDRKPQDFSLKESRPISPTLVGLAIPETKAEFGSAIKNCPPKNSKTTQKILRPTNIKKVSTAWQGILGPHRDNLIALHKRVSINRRGYLLSKRDNASALLSSKLPDQGSCSIFAPCSQRKTSLGSFPLEKQESFQASLDLMLARSQRLNNQGGLAVRKLKRRYTKVLKRLSKSKASGTEQFSTFGQQYSRCG
jgi:hypothetical protein